jgi:hypothetical protein
MKKFLYSEQARAFTLALVILGIGLIVFGAYRYIDATRQLNDNMAQKVHDSGEDVSKLTNEQAQMLMGADVARRELVQQQNYAFILGGVGLVLIAVGWLGGDFLAARRQTTSS